MLTEEKKKKKIWDGWGRTRERKFGMKSWKSLGGSLHPAGSATGQCPVGFTSPQRSFHLHLCFDSHRWQNPSLMWGEDEKVIHTVPGTLCDPSRGIKNERQAGSCGLECCGEKQTKDIYWSGLNWILLLWDVMFECRCPDSLLCPSWHPTSLDVIVKSCFQE